jgi:hypothetical protein
MDEKRESNAKRKELEAKGKTKGKANFEGVNFWTAYPRASVIGPQLCKRHVSFGPWEPEDTVTMSHAAEHPMETSTCRPPIVMLDMWFKV